MVETIDIIAKEWFDRRFGNSYFAVHVTVNFEKNDCQDFFVPFTYGYGDRYLQVVKSELVKRGFIQDSKRPLSLFCHENGILLRRNKIENCKKRDLKESNF